MIINVTYRLPNNTWQSDFSAQSVEEFIYFFLGQKDVEYRISVEMADIPLVLKGIREAKEATLKDVAANMVAKYDKSTLHNIEASKRKLGLKTLEDICQAMSLKTRIEISGNSSDFKRVPKVHPFIEDEDLDPSIFE